MSEPKKLRDLSFHSDEELKKLCHDLAMSMHYKNRVALGESGFVHALAELTLRIGEVWEQHRRDPEINAAYGGGYSVGKLNRQEQRAYLFSLLYPDSGNNRGERVES